MLLGRAIGHKTEKELTLPVAWEDVFRLAGTQNVFPLVFEAASAVPGFTGDAQYVKYMSKALKQTSDQIRQTHAFLLLYQAFLESGLHPLVIKGIVCRQLYGALCDHRPSGDEDILIQKQEFESVSRVFLSKGYRSEYEAVTDLQLERLQEITFSDPESGLRVEVHINLFGNTNDRRTKMNQYFRKVFQTPRKVLLDGTELWTMCHTDHFLFLVLHASNHLTGGFGVRLMLDILQYLERYGKEIDWEYVDRILQEMGAQFFLSDLIMIGNQYFGFQLEMTGPPGCPEALLEDMLSSGVFGNATQSQRTASNMTRLVRSGHPVKTALLFVFPERRYFVRVCPEILEHPWLLPVCWVRRWLLFLRRNRKEGGRLMAESNRIRKRRKMLLKQYGVL